MLKNKAIWFLLIFLTFSVWYNERYGMDYASKREINSPLLENKILIATQGSAYKNLLTSALIDSLKNQEVYLKIIDVNELPIEKHTAYQAIIIMHTWEIWMSPRSVKQFIRKTPHQKIYVVSTSGSGELMFEGLDGFATASIKEDIKTDSERVLSWLNNKNDHICEPINRSL